MKKWLVILFCALFIGGLISPFASSSPDGLEKVAEQTGFLVHTGEAKSLSLIPDYNLPGVKNTSLATAFAGMIGTLISFGIVYLIFRLWLKGNMKEA